MRRITLPPDDKLADPFDQQSARHVREHRSEALRGLLRGRLGNARIDDGRASHCVTTVSSVCNAMRPRTPQGIRRPPMALPALHSS